MRRMLRLTAPLALALAGCGGAGDAPTPIPSSAPVTSRAASSTTTEAPIEPTPEPATAGDEAVSYVPHAALTDALERAEVRLDGDLWASFGGAAGMKYTLGGWATRSRPVTVDGVPAVAGRGRDTRMLLPRANADAKLTLRVRSAAAGDP